MVGTLESFNKLIQNLPTFLTKESNTKLVIRGLVVKDDMPYLGLKGKGLLAGVTVSSGMAFILFGRSLSHGL